MPIELFCILLFGSLILFLAMGMPIAFATGSAGLIGLLLAWGPQSLYLIASRTLQNMNSYTLVAIAPFVLMGMVMERSGIGRELFEVVYQWAGSFKGSLAVTAVLVCTIMAAMTGVVGAAVTTVGMIALPAMLKRNYSKHLALGSCCAGGSLGVLIPPSIIFIIYGSCTNISVGKLFMGGFATGGLLSLIFIFYILIRSYIQPDYAPALDKEDHLPLKTRVRLLKNVIAPILLVVLVLGVIFAGLATPTEAAGVGALGAIVCAMFRPSFTWRMFNGILIDTVKITCMVMWIVFGSSFFVAVFAGAGGAQLVEDLLIVNVSNRWIILFITMGILFLLGCFMDSIAIVLLCAPIFTPIIIALKFDPIWFGIIFNLNLQMAYITPPFGYSLFYLKGVAPEGVTTGDIFRSVWPFVGLQFITLLLCIKFPILAMWLSDMMIG
ncbi:MAG: TRAP transporter large permease subunit [Deltaproteobacteria bacterium]|nr:TRAP transporter large permease subunit [Deltaproteobacteria bacterium]